MKKAMKVMENAGLLILQQEGNGLITQCETPGKWYRTPDCFAGGCIMKDNATGRIYKNVGTDMLPVWDWQEEAEPEVEEPKEESIEELEAKLAEKKAKIALEAEKAEKKAKAAKAKAEKEAKKVKDAEEK